MSHLSVVSMCCKSVGHILHQIASGDKRSKHKSTKHTAELFILSCFLTVFMLRCQIQVNILHEGALNASWFPDAGGEFGWQECHFIINLFDSISHSTSVLLCQLGSFHHALMPENKWHWHCCSHPKRVWMCVWACDGSSISNGLWFWWQSYWSVQRDAFPVWALTTSIKMCAVGGFSASK